MSNWQQRFKVHPATDLFPMMSAEELAKLGADIKKNMLREQVTFYKDGDAEVVIDGRNRLEAMERVGINPGPGCFAEINTSNGFDPVAYIISLNIHRRHLTKRQQADLIVAALKAGEKVSRQLGGKPKKGGRPKSKLKADAVAAGKKHGIGERTMERSLAEDEGKAKTHRPKWAEPDSAKLNAARQRYLKLCEAPDVDIDAEIKSVTDALREIASKRATIH